MVYVHGMKYVIESGMRGKGEHLWIDVLCKSNDIWRGKITVIERYKVSVLWKAQEERSLLT